MAISTSELLACVHRAGCSEVNEIRLTRWKHLQFIESHRPGRGRGRGRGPAQWDEAMCGTVCAIAHSLRARRDLEDAALSAWLADNPVPLPTVRKLLIKSGERWLEPLPLTAALPLDLPESERIARLSQHEGNLDDQIDLQAEQLADKSAMLAGIPRRYRRPLARHAIKVALGLATQADFHNASRLLSKVAPELEGWLSREISGLRDSIQPMFSVAVIRRVIGTATDEDLLQARTTHARNLPHVVLMVFLTLILWSAGARVGSDLALTLAGLLAMQHPAYAFTGFLLERTRR